MLPLFKNEANRRAPNTHADTPAAPEPKRVARVARHAADQHTRRYRHGCESVQTVAPDALDEERACLPRHARRSLADEPQSLGER